MLPDFSDRTSIFKLIICCAYTRWRTGGLMLLCQGSGDFILEGICKNIFKITFVKKINLVGWAPKKFFSPTDENKTTQGEERLRAQLSLFQTSWQRKHRAFLHPTQSTFLFKKLNWDLIFFCCSIRILGARKIHQCLQ